MRSVLALLCACVTCLSAATVDTVSITALPSVASEASTTVPAKIRLTRTGNVGDLTVDLSIAHGALGEPTPHPLANEAADYTLAVVDEDGGAPIGTPASGAGSISGGVTIPDGDLSVEVWVYAVHDTSAELGGTLVFTIEPAAAYERNPTFFTTITLADDDLRLEWVPLTTTPTEGFDGDLPAEGGVRLRLWDIAGGAEANPPAGTQSVVRFRLLDEDGAATLGSDYLMTLGFRHAGWVGGTILDRRSVTLDPATETWTRGVKLLIGADKDDTVISVTTGSAATVGSVLAVNDLVRVGAGAEFYRITTITSPGAQTSLVTLSYGLLATAAEGALVRNNPNATISSNGEIQQVTLDDVRGSLDIALTPVYDSTREGGESISLRLIESADYIIASPTDMSLVIADDDVLLTLSSVRDATRDPSVTGQFLLALSGAALADITVPLVVDDGALIAGTDYVALPASVTIPAGATQLIVEVTALSASTASGTISLSIDAPNPDFILSGSGSSSGATATVNLSGTATDGGGGGGPVDSDKPTPASDGGGSSCGAGGLAGLLLAGLVIVGLRRRQRI